MKRLGRISVLFMLLLSLTLVSAYAETMLIPVGRIVGLQLKDGTVTVAAFDDNSPACRDSGLKIGDVIVKVNEKTVTSTEDVRSALSGCGDCANLTLRRGNKELCLEVTPEQTAEGPRLGVYLRQGIAGIGTVTWYDPASQTFGALGHGVTNGKGGLLTMTQGSIFPAGILSVVRGKSGQPGLLKGSAGSDAPCGEVTKNTVRGVFGKTASGWAGQPVAAASADQLHTGPAVILSTVCGECPAEYSVEILKVYPTERSDGRNLLLKVTDTRLLDSTGGIVQGMSGSPILQDGRLVGAVTHVLVGDPTMGYGIYIGNMLDAAA